MHPDRPATRSDPGTVGAWIIHLQSRPEPVELVAELSALGLNPKLVPAVDGYAEEFTSLLATGSLPDFDLKRSEAFLGFRPTPPMVACAMSHQMVYRRMIEDGYSLGLIFEDDARMLASARQLQSLLRWMPRSSPTVVQLVTRGTRFRDGRVQATIDGGVEVFAFRYPPGQTVAYALNRSAASRLAGPVIGAADWPLSASVIEFFGVAPWLAKETELPTSIPLPDFEIQQLVRKTLLFGRLRTWAIFGLPYRDYLYRVWLPTIEAGVQRRIAERKGGVRDPQAATGLPLLGPLVRQLRGSRTR